MKYIVRARTKNWSREKIESEISKRKADVERRRIVAGPRFDINGERID